MSSRRSASGPRVGFSLNSPNSVSIFSCQSCTGLRHLRHPPRIFNSCLTTVPPFSPRLEPRAPSALSISCSATVVWYSSGKMSCISCKNLPLCRSAVCRSSMRFFTSFGSPVDLSFVIQCEKSLFGSVSSEGLVSRIYCAARSSTVR